MSIKSSTALRNDYSSISNLAHESGEPIYKMRLKIAEAELSRLKGEPTVTLDEARSRLSGKYMEGKT